jgi:hypothetical protein
LGVRVVFVPRVGQWSSTALYHSGR